MDEADWVAAMDADPDGVALLGIFADWLDERGDERGGAFRLLWEAGKVGENGPDRIGGYWVPDGGFGSDRSWLPEQWLRTADPFLAAGERMTVRERMRLAAAWAEADWETRERWREGAFYPRMSPERVEDVELLHAESVARESAGPEWVEYTGPAK